MGLICSSVPASAALPEIRPPLRRNLRSSTIKCWRILPHSSSQRTAISSITRPSAASLAAASTIRPSPNEAPRVSSTRIFRSGYFSASSRATSPTPQQVPLTPLDSPTNSTSSPLMRYGSMPFCAASGVTMEVCTDAPRRSAS